ncbi:MAG: fused response regulator/phosphatase [Natronospirillum sp.]|uniref:ATP-binding SpoIIE family protein phosphatase n=1 Tax=Natronospirillum sp. TaxID=2812955 RepID=UPI0025DC510B|nr:fused response regulator/phosphatase [Natronospirillum sp.]MCH8551278.1 fused response regulator/phosphatase [Natronospirillum sp.]
MTEELRVLIADDNQTDRMILSAIVRKEGHQVLEAADGQEAIDVYSAQRPDLVLLDVLMPVLDGMDAAREIKALAGNELVPIIFLTSLQDADSLAQCLNSGGDDFLTKPYNRVILRAKLLAFSRMRSMHGALQANHRQLLLEQAVAKKVYDNVTQSGHVRIDNVRYALSSRAMFNGDTVLAQYRPDGGVHVLLGDFTGHGLPAAIGAMPLAEAFYGMTSKGFELEEIVREMNTKLNRVLPTNFFCCAVALHIDMLQKIGRAWVGGVPDCFFYDAADQSVTALPSINLPLGVTEGHQFSLRMHEFAMHNGDRLFMWSDGIVEAENQGGEMFGEARLRQIFTQVKDPRDLFTDLLAAVKTFQGDNERADDTTLVEVTMADPPQAYLLDLQEKTGRSVVPLDWEVRLVFPAQTLKYHNPMPLIMHVLSETEGLKAYSTQLYTIISELYSNALEHGVLGLDSELKAGGEGFGRYYQFRQERLEQLEEGHIILTMEQKARGNAGLLTIRMEDSGSGFDHADSARHAERVSSGQQGRALSGRGMALVRELCSRVEYLGMGNVVEVDFNWPQRRL